MEMQERLELIKQGNVLNPTNLRQYSVLLEEEEIRKESMRARMRQEEANQGQQEVLGEAQQEALEREEIEGPPPEEEEGMSPEGGMPEDPPQAGPAQERLQGGPEAQQIQQREFEANAPT